MALFEFVTVMISVILALAATQLFLGLAPLVQTRHAVRLSAAHAGWVASLFAITFLHWWSLWDFRDLEWTFPMFAVSLVGPSLWFFAVTLINPADLSDDPVDLSSHFREIRRPFLGVVLLAMVFFTIDGPLFGTEGAFNRLRVAQIAVMSLAALGIVSSSDRVQVLVSFLTLAAVLWAAAARLLPGVVL